MECKSKPNRKHPRTWKPSDLRRIAKTLEKRGHKPAKIIAEIAIGLGLGVVICKTASLLKAALSIKRMIAKLGGVLLLSSVIAAALQILSKGALIKVPILNRVGIGLIIILSILDGIIKQIKEIVEEVETVENITTLFDDVCKEIENISKAVL